MMRDHSSGAILASNDFSDELVFGSLHARINRDDHQVIGKPFSGCTFTTLSWNLIMEAKLEEILDLCKLVIPMKSYNRYLTYPPFLLKSLYITSFIFVCYVGDEVI